MATTKGFIKDWNGNRLLPITRGELVLDSKGFMALVSAEFLAGTHTDADGNKLPGLITAAERAMLTGGNGQNISDVYTKLGYINSGLKVGDNTLHFYETVENVTTATPISIVGSEGVTVGIANNTLNVSLTSVLSDTTTITNGIVRNITVDKYGRVTAVSSGALLDADIPQTLTGKILSGCTVAAAPTADLGIANKKYVDDKVAIANGIATGSLKFAGAIGTEEELNTVWSGIADRKNNYYKVTPTSGTLVISVDKLHYPPKASGNISLKTGDTLIVYENPTTNTTKFVYIPSADDVTSITVYGNGSGDFQNKIGNVTLNFSEVFDVTDADNTATITLAKADANTDGYLSSADYKKFAGYETGLAVSYTPTVTNTTAGQYIIGILTIGGTPTTVYGKNNISALTLENNADGTAVNPRLKFTETGQNDVYINIQGSTGIVATKTGTDTITLATNITSGNTSYISASGNTVSAVIGKFNTESEGGYDDGLVDFATFSALANKVANIAEVIGYSLNGTASATEKYKYGSTDLVSAVALTI